jgi:hypothetical protein
MILSTMPLRISKLSIITIQNETLHNGIQHNDAEHKDKSQMALSIMALNRIVKSSKNCKMHCCYADRHHTVCSSAGQT